MNQKQKTFTDEYGNFLEIEDGYDTIYLDITPKARELEGNTVVFDKKDVPAIILFLKDLIEE